MRANKKLEYINNYIDKLNKRLIKRSFKVEFENKGANNYCLVIGSESFKFNTYDDMTNCLTFIDLMFNKAENEIKKGK